MKNCTPQEEEEEKVHSSVGPGRRFHLQLLEEHLYYLSTHRHIHCILVFYSFTLWNISNWLLQNGDGTDILSVPGTTAQEWNAFQRSLTAINCQEATFNPNFKGCRLALPFMGAYIHYVSTLLKRPAHTGPDNENENDNDTNARPRLVE